MARKDDVSDDEVRSLINECINIIKEDREKAHYQELHGKYGEKTEKEPEEAGEGDPPPPGPPVEEVKVEYGLWGKKKTHG